MKLDYVLPQAVRSFLEKHGIEGDAMSRHHDDLFIECDDFETAFQLRELVLEFHSCCLVSHPESHKPTLLVHHILNQ